MPGYQFLHIDTFAVNGRVPRKSGGGASVRGKMSIRNVLQEAARVPGHAPHVEEPKPPVLVYGISPLELGSEISEISRILRDPRGRKLRPDTQLLLSGVVSYPIPSDVVRSDKSECEKFGAWGLNVLKFLEKEWGANLRCVVSHIDEKFLHFHFYVTPDLRTGESNLDRVHPGFRAREAAGSKSDRTFVVHKARTRAYKTAMREFQDRFFSTVSMHHGHARLGPGKRRLSRFEWKLEQSQAQALGSVAAEARQILDLANSEREAAVTARKHATQEITVMKKNAQEAIAREMAAVKHLVDLLVQWVRWMERRASAAPQALLDLLDSASTYLRPKP